MDVNYLDIFFTIGFFAFWTLSSFWLWNSLKIRSLSLIIIKLQYVFGDRKRKNKRTRKLTQMFFLFPLSASQNKKTK